MTHNENLTFTGFKCYNQVPSASTNQGNVKKITFDFASDNGVAVLMPWQKFEQNMLPLAAQTSTEHYLVQASEETRAVDLLIYLLYDAAAT